MIGAGFLICGYGARGTAVAENFMERGLPAEAIAIVEIAADRLAMARARGHSCVSGDATERNRLRIAGAGVINDIIICVDDEAAPAVMSAARAVSPSAVVSAVVKHPDTKGPVIAAGADIVLVLSEICGRLLAQSMLSGLPDTKRL